MADPLYDLMQANPQMALSNMVAPNAMSMLQGQPDPRTFPTGAQPGKIPYMEDPRIGGSVLEALMLAGSAAPVGRMAMGAGGAARMIPEMMQAAPGVPAGAGTAASGMTLAAILGGGEAGAGEQPFAWQDTNQDRVNRLKQIDAEIAKAASARPSAKSERAQNAQTQMQAKRVDALTKEKDSLVTAQQAEQQNALQLYQTAQEKSAQEAAAKKSAETSLLDRVPGTRAAVMAVSPYLSYKAGKFMGERLHPGVAIPAAAGFGGISGAASTAGQAELDLNSLPRSSPTRQEAEADLSNPNFWLRTALASGVSGGFGVKGATMGYAGTQPRIVPPSLPPTQQPGGPQNTGLSTTATPGAGGATPASLSTSRRSGPGSYVTYTTPDGGKVVETPYGWRAINPETGKQTGFIKRPEGALERLMKGD